jgi:trehalose/maltose transport system substrate-binding protein
LKNVFKDGVANTVTGRPDVALPGWISASVRRPFAIFLLAMLLGSCGQSAPEVTLNYLRPGWPLLDPTELPLLQQFTRETGIQLKTLPFPENSLDQLDLSRKLLQEGSSGPDVLGIDLIWSGVLEGDLTDLRPYLAAEISALKPQLLPSYTVGGRVVAIPLGAQIGVLEYRTDLLREYGYDHPPKTWDELERMAERIQTGERAKGKKDFWGYVWQGAATEALTCNALEWQVAEGGGRIIENDRTISVNNPATIRAWQRAKRWIGWISPPSVVAYAELDSENLLDSGGAAFGRVWGGITIAHGGRSRLLHWRTSLNVGRTGYTSIPGGRGGRAGTLGGSGLAVSGHSLHPREAIELVRFLNRAEIHANEQDESASVNRSAQPEFYDLPSFPDLHNHSGETRRPKSGVVGRPAGVAGRTYEQVARAYSGAVRSVLTGQRGAPEAAADVERQLIKITGFTTGPPQTVD